jgi:site-specific DNA-methyltransferase (adenine-specific)
MDNFINKIINDDCFNIFPYIADKSIDMILCDLPYGTTRNVWDLELPLNELWQQYNRIIKDNGAIVLTAMQPFTSMLISSNIHNFRYEWIWQKDSGTGFLNAKRQPLRDHENILVFYKRQCTYNPQFTEGKPYAIYSHILTDNYGKRGAFLSENDGFRYPKTVLKFKRGGKKLHPTQKPVELFEYLIKTYTNENDLVLDNCVGSGTTAVACLNTNRKFIGIEKDFGYYDVAMRRLNETFESQTYNF